MSRPLRRAGLIAAAFLVVAGGLYPARLGLAAYRWQLWHWLPGFAVSELRGNEGVPDDRKHLIFLMVDHFEPSRDAGQATAQVDSWLAKFRAISDAHRDSYGRRFLYSWFQRYDERNDAVLERLTRAVHDGYGELELHWHHPRELDNDSFDAELGEAVLWFQRYGAFLSATRDPRTQFAFIHGNWALDASTPKCGVTRELEILHRHGCFADFTFSTIATPAQPKKINAIYYAPDGPQPKSFDTGIDVEAGKPPLDALMIFQGPLSIGFTDFFVEYGAIEDYSLPSDKRIGLWIDRNIHVKGRPEWVFAKVYSHGMQSEAQILDRHLAPMLRSLRSICDARGIRLHYMTAREAYNVVKAAEAGRTGDPEEYRDFLLPPPCNRYFVTDRPGRVESCDPEAVVFTPVPDGAAGPAPRAGPATDDRM